MSILSKLEEEKILCVHLEQSKKYIDIGEACDYYFDTVLSKKEFAQLIIELQDLWRQMIDQED